jgi:hypothetical protein
MAWEYSGGGSGHPDEPEFERPEYGVAPESSDPQVMFEFWARPGRGAHRRIAGQRRFAPEHREAFEAAYDEGFEDARFLVGEEALRVAREEAADEASPDCDVLIDEDDSDNPCQREMRRKIERAEERGSEMERESMYESNDFCSNDENTCCSDSDHKCIDNDTLESDLVEQYNEGHEEGKEEGKEEALKEYGDKRNQLVDQIQSALTHANGGNCTVAGYALRNADIIFNDFPDELIEDSRTLPALAKRLEFVRKRVRSICRSQKMPEL